MASDLTELETSANSIRVLREHQQAMEESESRFRTIFESSQDAIVITNDEGDYIQANPAVETIFGLSPEQLIGRRIWDFVNDAAGFSAVWHDFLDAGSFRAEMPITGADGQVRHVDAYAVANILPGRHLCGVPRRHRAQSRPAGFTGNERTTPGADPGTAGSVRGADRTGGGTAGHQR